MSERVAIVTGASRGIGSRIATGLLADGFNVVGIARSPISEWEVVDSAGFYRHVCDLTDESAVKRLFSEVRKQYGCLEVVVNNAGVFSSDLLLTASADRFASVLQTNLLSAQIVTREAVKLMRPKGFGRVVSISSIATRIPVIGNALYATSKVALEELMGGFAMEFRSSGITFNNVAISFVEDTGMVNALPSTARASYEEKLLSPTALDMSQVMHAIRFLVAPNAAPVTAQTIVLGSPS